MVHFSVRSCLIFVFVLAFLLLVESSNRVVEVNVICNKTENPSFCLSLLNSKPGGAVGEDLVNLTQYTIDVVRVNVTNTIKYINWLIKKSTSDPKAREHYQKCLSQFNYALAAAEYTQQMLNSRNYLYVDVAASDVMTDADLCALGLSSSNPPFHDASLLSKYVSIVDHIVQIILIMSNYLMD
ncbi:pectinesterase inhibitor-like [Gastrolobium bilobum]|uniref:pectinesterase inhibitor-like n=1 Tax=Gastrolobium bilobum TaxID=150636 RepID=UPI002AAF3E13|nr:pectinesterase inhibitor-like [Gastrolobium bilobum]